jgi:hypothetical protein
MLSRPIIARSRRKSHHSDGITDQKSLNGHLQQNLPRRYGTLSRLFLRKRIRANLLRTGRYPEFWLQLPRWHEAQGTKCDCCEYLETLAAL